MKLFASLASSLAILGMIWTMVCLQPAVANVVITQTPAPTGQKVNKNQKVFIEGVTQTLSLHKVGELWEKVKVWFT